MPVKEAPTLELVLKRNSVERIKRDKSPLGMLDELPALIGAGYEQVDEEDLVRLKWWGLYHDKPKIGTFMLRIKLAGGIASPEQLRAIGEISNLHGRGEGELTTRQNVQLHYLELAALPDVFARLDAAGLTSAGACGDTVRNITGCPVAGLAHDELFDPTPVLQAAAEFLYGHPDYSDLPRKHKIAITACTDACAAPEINCISLIGAIRDGEEGFGVLVGGGLSSAAHRARAGHLGTESRSGAGARRDPRRVARRPPLPRVAREGTAQVHDRRHRRGGDAGARRVEARPAFRRLCAAAPPPAFEPP